MEIPQGKPWKIAENPKTGFKSPPEQRRKSGVQDKDSSSNVFSAVIEKVIATYVMLERDWFFDLQYRRKILHPVSHRMNCETDLPLSR
jgi:hypothetical protein